MKIIDIESGNTVDVCENMRFSCALGIFDGVHIGHKALLEAAAKKPDNATHSAVFTFSGYKKSDAYDIISGHSQKLALFCGCGIDVAIICDFAEVKDMSPDEFVSDILIKKCHVDTAICGFNFTFGKNALGSAENLRELMESHGKKAVIVAPVKCENDVVNSTSIRVMIESGDMESARKMLGRCFSLEATVESGNKIGRTIGVPTINQFFPENSVIPKRGTYASKCVIDGKDYISVSNVGVRPTVSGSGKQNCETHIINFSGDLYGKTVKVEFCKYIREEVKFDSLEKLSDRIKSDINFTKTYFDNKG